MNDINTLRNQFAIHAMKALIQARSALPEDSEDSFFYGVSCGINSQIDLLKEDNTKYAWGEAVAEEAYDMAEWMTKETIKRGWYE
jgi:hypothetical protein